MEIRTLLSIPSATLHRAFSTAFSDYAVPLELSPDALAELHRRRGVRYELSVGAFSGDHMVGFTFNGLGTWNHGRCGYDAGTGVIPSARGQGLATRMMERSLSLLSAEGTAHYLLEVLQSNLAAVNIYRGLGFRISRELLCWRLGDVPARTIPGLQIQSIAEDDHLTFDITREGPLWGATPSWQNSAESITRASAARTTLIAQTDGALTGYAIIFRNGDLAQLAVAPAMRRRGIGTALLRAARRYAGTDLTVTNTDARDPQTTRFLQALGARERARQYEMILDL